MKKRSRCPAGTRKSSTGKTCRKKSKSKTSRGKASKRKTSGRKTSKGKKYRTSKNCKYTHVKIKNSSRSEKKLMAIFENKNTDRKKTIHFGSRGMSDFTKHKDKARRSRYLKRHKKRENWNKCDTAGALSRWILWNKTSKKSSISGYKKKFSLK